MYWIEAVVHTTTAGIDPVSGLLLMNGITGFAVEDSEDLTGDTLAKAAAGSVVDKIAQQGYHVHIHAGRLGRF